jgi:vancomycin resistance protein YoaR
LAKQITGLTIQPAPALPLPPDPIGEPAQASSDNRLLRVGSRLVLGVAILSLAIAAALFAFRENYDNRIYPGVYVAGIDVSGMSRSEAAAALEVKAAEIENSRAYLDALDRHWAPTLAELGVTVDIDQTLDNAFAVGRENAGSTRIGSMLETMREENRIPLEIELSQDTLRLWAEGVDEELGIQPNNAQLSVVDGAVTISPETNGKIVDVASLQQILERSLRSFEAPTTALPIIDKQPTTYAADFVDAKREIESALSAPVSITYESQQWEVSPVDFGQFLGVEIDPEQSGPQSVAVVVDERGLAQWLSELIAPEVNLDPKNAKVAWDGEKLKATSPGVDGMRMLPSSLAKSLADSFFSSHAGVSLPIQVLEPEVNGGNLDQLGITTELARGSSNFDGSEWSRSTNIEVGTQLLNGTLVRPGGEFSFNHAIGVITTDLGFVEADVIDGERIGRDIGGGICQVSTTAFRAALLAGLEMTEWHPHRYRLRFYELEGWTVGLDASILQPEGDPFSGGDLKFRNPSNDSWLLVESYTDGPRAVVVIYGPDLGYTVELSDPVMGSEYPPTGPVEVVDDKLPAGSVVQSEWAGSGLEVTYYRTVYDASGAVVREDSFYTFFSPRGDVYKVSPDMQGYSPAG